MSEPPIGIEPMTYALREARAPAADVLAALLARITARIALAALGLSGDPVHEPVHGRGPASRHLGTVRNLSPGAVLAPRERVGRHGRTQTQTPRPG
jgi:hypothetical protein